MPRERASRPVLWKTMSAPIDLQATFIPNEGEFFRVKLALEIAIDEVVNEPGCIRYELTEATEDKPGADRAVGFRGGPGQALQGHRGPGPQRIPQRAAGRARHSSERSTGLKPANKRVTPAHHPKIMGRSDPALEFKPGLRSGVRDLRAVLGRPESGWSGLLCRRSSLFLRARHVGVDLVHVQGLHGV